MQDKYGTVSRTTMKKQTIILQGIQVSAHCGVTEAERATRQPLLVDLHFRCPNQAAFHSDRLSDTVDYGAVVKCIRDLAEHQPFALLESLAEQLCQSLFQQYPLTHLTLWVRKTHPPLERLQGSVGIQVIRNRPLPYSEDESAPSEFLLSHLSQLPKGRALDVAAGTGRHSLLLALNGFTVHAIDRNSDALTSLQTLAQPTNLSLSTQVMDLELDPLNPPDLGHESYEVILVFFYLYRPIFPKLLQALKPGGILLYETFLIDNHYRHQHPRRKEFCLDRNELLDLVAGMRIMYYEEGPHGNPPFQGGPITARLLAQKPGSEEKSH